MVIAKIPKRGNSSDKIPIEIKSYGGINTLPSRQLGQPSAGKNFYTKNGELYTRPGLLEIDNPPSLSSPIYAIHSCKQAQLTERLIVQSGSELHHRPDELGSWSLVDSGISGYAYGNVWREHLVLSFGSTVLDYGIETASASDLRGGATDMPGCLFTATWKDYLWTIPGPNWAPAYKTQFNGYQYVWDDELEEYTEEIVDRDIIVWPEDFNVPMSDGSSLMAAFPFSSSLFCITGKSTWHIYGDNEDNFEVHQGSHVGAYENGEFCPAALVSDMPMWIGNDYKIYRYTGSVVEPVSQPIDKILQEEFSVVGLKPRAYGLDNKFWLFLLRNILIAQTTETSTKCLVFDPAEGEWFLYEFAGHIISAGEYDGKILLGTKDGRVLYMNDVDTDDSEDITTSLTIGPADMQARKIKAKTFYLTAEAESDFTVDVYTQCDSEAEVSQGYITFNADTLVIEDIRLNSVSGQNVSVRIETTDRINKLQKAELTVIPKRLK